MSCSGPAGSARRRAAIVLIAVSVVLGVAAWARWPRLAVGTALIAPDDPVAALDAEIAAEFGLARPLVFVVEARDGNLWTRAGLDKVAALTREVLALPGVVATDVVSLASPNMRELRLRDGGMEPTYLMPEVPADQAAIDALRAHVDADPNYGGNLTSRDGAAALVVANFLPGAPDAAIATAALALRARHEDAQFRVHVVGAAVLLPMAQDAAGQLVWQLALAVLLGVVALLLGVGLRAAAAAVGAALLAALWSFAALVVLGSVIVPWSGYGVVTAALLAAATAVAALPLRPRDVLGVALPVVCAGAALGAVVTGPARALGVALALGSGCAVLAGAACRYAAGLAAVTREPAAHGRPPWLRLACLAAIALAWLGTIGLRASFGLAGYGERYLPAEARGGLEALRRHFPPPSTFVVRLRGAPGFVAEPAVLEAIDAVERTLRAEPGVRSAQSLADIVQLVHRSFNDDDPAYFALPDERGLIARYLTLAYSPGFRRFVDRGLSRTTLWVYVDGDDPATLERVHARLDAALRQHAVAGVTVDPIAGDGAVALEMARTGAQLLAGIAAAAGAHALVAGVLAGGGALRVTLDAGLAALGALLVTAGLAAWLGLVLDLVLLPVLACVVLLGGAVASLARADAPLRPLAAFGLALAVAALPLAGTPSGATRALVPLLVAALAALASLVAAGRR